LFFSLMPPLRDLRVFEIDLYEKTLDTIALLNAHFLRQEGKGKDRKFAEETLYWEAEITERDGEEEERGTMALRDGHPPC